MTHPRALQEQIASAVATFERRFNRRPTVAAAAPGRVNLIGEHIDYNEGFVLPLAIDRQTLIVAGPRQADQNPIATVVSTDVEEEAVFEVGPDMHPGEPKWSNYVRGPVAGCVNRGMNPGGFDAVLNSTVPFGSGLSSSASIEVAMVTLVEQLCNQRLDPVDKALLAQKAEHDFAGVPCGIMDQFISVMGKAGHALLIDCRSHATQLVPLNDPSVVVLIINSNIVHELSGGEYRQRREQCEVAARILGVHSLRDAAPAQLEAARADMDDLTYRRARHVVTEIQRTVDAAAALRQRDWNTVGRLMAESHDSLRDDFEVSTRELDLLVALTQAHMASGAIIGSRMTGGGFGGCTVSLARADAVEEMSGDIARAYEAATGTAPTIFVTTPADGARGIDLSQALDAPVSAGG